MVKDRSRERDRRRLLEAGWESKLRDGLVVWRRPGGRGSWYSQEVAMEILEALLEAQEEEEEEEEEHQDHEA